MKIKSIFVLSLFLCEPALNAFAPIVHLVIAKQYIDARHITNPQEKRAILLGAVYPDIRYVARVKRSVTHRFTTLHDIDNAPSAFAKGTGLHNLADQRNGWFEEQCSPIPTMQNRLDIDIIKLIADQLAYETFVADGIKTSTLEALSHIDNQEISTEIPESIVKKYYENIGIYIQDSPFKSLSHLAYPKKESALIIDLLPQFVNNANIAHATAELLNYFKKLFESGNH